MREIGGFLEIGGLSNKPYHDKAIALNTATNAVIYLIKSKKINKIYLPYYICKCLDEIKGYCEVEYYKIKSDFSPDFNIELNDNEYLYIVNYFGMFNNDEIKAYKKIYKNIIIDNVQAFFQKPVNGVDTIYSCRKFFGVPDGAYLYTDMKLQEDIPQDKSQDRFKHLFGRLEDNANSNFQKYKDNEELLLNLELAYMSNSTKLILNAQQYNKIKKERTENYKYLNEELSTDNGLKLKDIEGAYVYPYYTNDAEELRKTLIKNKVYIPILWPNVLQQDKNSLEYKYANNILPIPCDQRYNIEDMAYICKIIREREKNV